MELLTKIVDGLQLLTIYAKIFILDVWLCSEYAFGTHYVDNYSEITQQTHDVVSTSIRRLYNVAEVV